jgi:antitoxin (DNA-binding transcriptional repressor) of toxin-antitoxin stability system
MRIRDGPDLFAGLPLVVTDHGRPVAALLPLPNADMETVSLSTSPKFPALIERSRERQSKEGGISSDEIRRRLGTTANPQTEMQLSRWRNAGYPI